MYNELSGYTAPCSEFNHEYDDSAEIMVKNISFHEETIPDETGKHICRYTCYNIELYKITGILAQSHLGVCHNMLLIGSSCANA